MPLTFETLIAHNKRNSLFLVLVLIFVTLAFTGSVGGLLAGPRAIFFGACLYFVIAGIAALLVFWLKLSLVNFIWLLAIAKVFHITAQAGFIGCVWYGRKRQLEN